MRKGDKIVEVCGKTVLMTVAIAAGVIAGDLICQPIEYLQSMVAREYEDEDDGDWYDWDDEVESDFAGLKEREG